MEHPDSITDHWSALLQMLGGWTTIVVFVTRQVSLAVRALEVPTPNSSPFYRWSWRYLNSALANPDVVQKADEDTAKANSFTAAAGK